MTIHTLLNPLTSLSFKESSSITELEFVCHNSQHPDSTPLDKMVRLYQALKKIPEVLPYMQDWSEGDDIQFSLAVILKDNMGKDQVLDIAHKMGVLLDLEQEVSSNKVSEIENGTYDSLYEPMPLKEAFGRSINLPKSGKQAQIWSDTAQKQVPYFIQWCMHNNTTQLQLRLQNPANAVLTMDWDVGEQSVNYKIHKIGYTNTVAQGVLDISYLFRGYK